MDFLEKIKGFFSSIKINYLPKIGAGLLAIALILVWMSHMYISLGLLICVGFIDLYLVFKKHDTISQWIHGLFPKAIDVIIVIGLLIYTWAVFGPVGFVPVLIGVIIGHLFWQE
jgi:hypothetical protein